MSMINEDTLEIPPVVWRKSESQLPPHGTPGRARYHYRHGDRPLRRICPACADAEMIRVQVYRAVVGRRGGKLGGRWPR